MRFLFPSLVVTAALAAPAFAANLLTNGDFETGDTGQVGSVPIPGWLNWGNSGWHHNDAGRTIGTKAIVLWWDDAGLWQDVPVVAGRDYEFSVKVLNWSGNLCTWNGLMRAEFYTSTGSKLLETVAGKYYAATDPKDEWVVLTSVITAPANAATGRMVLNLTDWFSGVGGVLNFDDASITLVAQQGQIYVSPALLNVAKGDANQQVNVQIPAECSASQDVAVTLTSDAPAVASPVGGTNGSITLNFPAGGSNEQNVEIHFGVVGTATLTATGCNALPGQVSVHVFDLSAIDLDVPYDLMQVGGTQQATVTGTFGAAGTRDVTAAVTYSVDPSAGVVSVDAAGQITADGLGTGQVTARLNGIVSESRTVGVVTPPPTHAEIAGSGLLLVDLAAKDATAGQDVWVNKGSLRDFARVGTPILGEVAGQMAVSFDASNAYQGPLAPPELRGGQGRTIEVWAYDAEIPAGVEMETMVAWGHRSGPDGSNLQFGFGDHASWGALGQWNPDLPWYALPPAEGNHPPLGQWDHLVYTFDPLETGTIHLYVNGVETNAATGIGALPTHAGHINLAAPNESEKALDLTNWQRGAVSLAVVRVHDGALTAQQVAKNYRLGITRPITAGDMDLDGDVDRVDLASFVACATGPAIPVGPLPCDLADFDGDGDADQDDFGMLQRCFSGDGVPASPGCQ